MATFDAVSQGTSESSLARRFEQAACAKRRNTNRGNMATYVLVHGAWHTGGELQGIAAPIQAMGHEVHTPTIKGNRPGDLKTIGLSEEIESKSSSTWKQSTCTT